jgi:2-polyprenyl-3-methyl-5-hydroxy-6-metoxy-1,4-benzoquinol methylase
MMDFSQRSSQPELMDTETVSYEQFRHCLRELETINHWTLAYRPTLRWLRRIGRYKSLSTLLDVGSGGGDMLRQIVRHHPGRASNTKLVGIDLNPWSKKAAEEWSQGLPLHFETGDIFDFEPTRHVDIIISSLFTHHLNDEQLVQFLRWMEAHATVGWFINDLHRHWLPYYFIKFVTHLFSRDRFIKHDAAVSVSRAFTRADWQRLLLAASIPMDQVCIRWHLPFRYCVERRK